MVSVSKYPWGRHRPEAAPKLNIWLVISPDEQMPASEVIPASSVCVCVCFSQWFLSVYSREILIEGFKWDLI